MSKTGPARALAGLAVAVLLAGGLVAALTHSTPSGKPRRPYARAGAAAGASADPGGGQGALLREANAGRLAAQAAEVARGKSEAGVIESQLAGREAGLQALEARLRGRAGAQARRVPRLTQRLSIQARYLGLTQRELNIRLDAGASLGRIADSIPGRSREGLIAVLMAPRLARLEPLVAAGLLKPAQKSRRELLIEAIVTVMVDRVHPKVERPHPLLRGGRSHAKRAKG